MPLDLGAIRQGLAANGGKPYWRGLEELVETEEFREMLHRVSRQLEHALPPGIETSGEIEQVLRLIAQAILELHRHPEYVGFLRMVLADHRQFPWIP